MNLVGSIRRTFLVLNWANFCFANLVGSIRRTAMKLYSGSKKFHSTCSGNIRPVQWTLPLIGWEQSSHVDEEERKIQMDDASVSILHSLRRELPYLLTCGRRSLVSGIQNDILVSWTTLWGMIKVYWLDLTWLDFSLHFGSCCLLHFCRRKLGPEPCISL